MTSRITVTAESLQSGKKILIQQQDKTSDRTHEVGQLTRSGEHVAFHATQTSVIVINEVDVNVTTRVSTDQIGVKDE